MTDETVTTPHDEHLDNPVGRLWRLLENMWSINAETQIGRAWSSYLNLPIDEPARFLPAWARLVELPDEAHAAIEAAAFPARKTATYLASVDRSRGVFVHAANAATPVSSALPSYSASDLTVLELCSGELIDLGLYVSPSLDALKNLRNAAQNLLEEVTRSGASSEFIVFLVEMMRRVIDEIDSYAAGGWEPIAAEWERLHGRARMTHDLKDQLERAPGVAKNFLIVVVAISQLLTGSLDAAQHDLNSADTFVKDVTTLVEAIPDATKVILPPEETSPGPTSDPSGKGDSK